jgi:lambda family phage portal protein
MARSSWLDRSILAVAPAWGVSRIRARAIAETLRHYEAASAGSRTQSWHRGRTDANAAVTMALGPLRSLSRDLVRNNAWARNGVRVITRNTVGWGIVPKPIGNGADRIADAWKRWAETTQCHADRRATFYGLEKLVMRTVVESGECLIRRRPRRIEDGLALPLQLQVLEPDFIDTNKYGVTGVAGGPIIQGIEFDKIGRRVAYWLFPQHPGSARGVTAASYRVPAEDVCHVYDLERAGQDRGAPWLASVIVSLREFDEYEDATLVKQKIAACLAGFIHGAGDDYVAGPTDTPGVERLVPGSIRKLAPGEEITFTQPPATGEDRFSVRALRRIAAGIGSTYEDLTGDYSQVNFSSARMSRLAHWANVEDWQWNTLIPQFCDVAWGWAMEAAGVAGIVNPDDLPGVEWTPRPMPMIEPDREARANLLMIRSGQKTLPQVLREQGLDVDSHLEEYAGAMKKIDALGLVLDSDARKVTQSGQGQQAEPKAPSADAEDDVEIDVEDGDEK